MSIAQIKMESVNTFILIYIQKEKKNKVSIFGAFTFWPAYEQKLCISEKKKKLEITKKRNHGENRRAKLDASALAQKVAVQEVGGAVGGETTVAMRRRRRRSFLGIRPRPHPSGSSATHHVSVVQVSFFPLPPPPQTRPSSSGGEEVVLHGGGCVERATKPPHPPRRKASSVCWLRAARFTVVVSSF